MLYYQCLLTSARQNASVEAMKLAKKRFRRRAGIDPVIGHLKSDHRLKRNFLKGFAGDQINLSWQLQPSTLKSG
jgi:IS5 family transposase